MPTIPVFKRAKTFHALDRAATVTGTFYSLGNKIKIKLGIRKRTGLDGLRTESGGDPLLGRQLMIHHQVQCNE
jgi:hypothetical protein